MTGAAHLSYAKAACLLARNGSRAQPTSVMRCMRDAGLLCAEQDELNARSLFVDGIIPESEMAAEEICVEADGKHFSTQKCPTRYFPFVQTTFHLDPLHVNRAIMSCFKDPETAWNVIDALNDGGKSEATALLEAREEHGVANAKRTGKVIAYLEGNIDHIAPEGPSLGAMESENQHLYGSRMDCWPCAWSVRGASDMARIISRRASKRAIPKMTRERSCGQSRRKRREGKELRFYEGQGLPAASVVKSVGKGYLPPHQASTRKMNPGKAYALYKGMTNLDRGI